MENTSQHYSMDELVFENRNKTYGAYYMRKKYTAFLIYSVLFGFFFSGVVVSTPIIYAKINNFIISNKTDIPVEKNVVVQMVEEIKPQEDEQFVQEEPVQQLEKAVQFTNPDIKEKVDETAEITTAADLEESQAGKQTVTEGADFGTLIDQNVGQTVEVQVEEKPFLVVEEPPQFPGGTQSLYTFIGKNIRYPEKALEMEVEGKVYVQFVVGSDGKVKDAKVIRKLDPDCDKEALRVVQLLPPWTPGRQSGKAVSVYYTLPIQFKIQKK